MLENQRFLELDDTWMDLSAANDPEGAGRSVLLTGRRAPSREQVATRVIPSLIATLEGEPHPEVASSALVALGRLASQADSGDELVRTVLFAHVSDGNVKVRESALLGLGLLGDAAAASELGAIVRGDGSSWLGTESVSARTRAFAAHALGLAAQRIDDKGLRQRAALALVEGLESDRLEADVFKVAALGALGAIELTTEASVPPSDLRQHELVQHVLSSASLSDYLTSWLVRSEGRSTWARTHAAVALGKLVGRSSGAARDAALASLVDITRDRRASASIRAGAALGLGEAVHAGSSKLDRAARKALEKQARRGQPIERRFARMALARAASRPSGTDDPFGRWRSTRGLLLSELERAKSGEMAWTALALGVLERRLHRAGVETGDAAAKAIAKLGRKRRSDDDSAALALALALTVRGTDIAPRYEEHLFDEFEATTTPVMRSFTALALGLAGGSGEAVQHATGVLQREVEAANGSTPMLWNSAVSLRVLGDPVDAQLVTVLEESPSSFRRRRVVDALAQTGSASSVEPLLTILDGDDEQDLLKSSAIDALAALCDPIRIPWRDTYSHALPYFAATPTLNGSGNGSAIVERPW